MNVPGFMKLGEKTLLFSCQLDWIPEHLCTCICKCWCPVFRVRWQITGNQIKTQRISQPSGQIASTEKPDIMVIIRVLPFSWCPCFVKIHFMWIKTFPGFWRPPKSWIAKCPANPSETRTSPREKPYPGPLHLAAWWSSWANIRSSDWLALAQNAGFAGSTVIYTTPGSGQYPRCPFQE